MFPLRQDHLTRLLKHVGFQQVDRYGDFQEEYEIYAPDFVVQVARKTWGASRFAAPEVSQHRFDLTVHWDGGHPSFQRIFEVAEPSERAAVRLVYVLGGAGEIERPISGNESQAHLIASKDSFYFISHAFGKWHSPHRCHTGCHQVVGKLIIPLLMDAGAGIGY